MFDQRGKQALGGTLFKTALIAASSLLFKAEELQAQEIETDPRNSDLPSLTLNESNHCIDVVAYRQERLSVEEFLEAVLYDLDRDAQEACDDFVKKLAAEVTVLREENPLWASQHGPLNCDEQDCDSQIEMIEPIQTARFNTSSTLTPEGYASRLEYHFEVLFEERLKELGVTFISRVLDRDCDREALDEISARVSMLAGTLTSTFEGQYELTSFRHFVEDMASDLDALLDPEPLFSIQLERAPTEAPIEIHIVDFDTFNAFPPQGEIIRPEEIGLDCSDMATLNFAASLALDNPKTMGVNEGIDAMKTWLLDDFLPKNPELLKTLGISDYRALTPKQSFLLTSAIIMERIEYSRSQYWDKNEDSKFQDLSLKNWNETRVNDGLPIHSLLAFGPGIDGNQVCRGFNACRGLHLAVVGIQDPKKTITASILALDSGVDPNIEFPGTVGKHASPILAHIQSHPEGDGYIVYASAIDWTFADNKYNGPEDVLRGLDFTAKRLPTILHRFRDSINRKEAVVEFYKKANENGGASQVFAEFAHFWYKELPTSQQQTVFDLLCCHPDSAFRKHLPPDPGLVNSFPQTVIRTEVKNPTGVEAGNKALTEYSDLLNKLALEHEDLFTGELSFQLSDAPEAENLLYQDGHIALTKDMSEELLLKKMKKHQELREELEQIQSRCSAKILISPLIDETENSKAAGCTFSLKDTKKLLPNMRDYFTDPDRQNLFRYKTFGIADGTSEPAYNGNFAFLPISLFLDDYNPQKLDKILLSYSPSKAQEKAEYLATLRDYEEVDDADAIYGIRLDPNAREEAASAYVLIEETFLELPESLQARLKKRPVLIEIANDLDYIKKGYGNAIKTTGRQVLFTSSIAGRNTSFYARRAGKRDSPDFVILSKGLDDQETYENAKQTLIEYLMIYADVAEQTEKLKKKGINLVYRNTSNDTLRIEDACHLSLATHMIEEQVTDIEGFVDVTVVIDDELKLKRVTARRKEGKDEDEDGDEDVIALSTQREHEISFLGEILRQCREYKLVRPTKTLSKYHPVPEK